MEPFTLEPHPELRWYFEQSACDLGFGSSPMTERVQASTEPEPPGWRELSAARRQAHVRAALRELSPRLQSVLEAAYEQRPHAVPLRHEHGLAAGLVARAVKRCKSKDELEKAIVMSRTLVMVAHEAFEMMIPRPGAGARSRRQARVQRWLVEDGVG